MLILPAIHAIAEASREFKAYNRNRKAAMLGKRQASLKVRSNRRKAARRAHARH